jgi:DnaK suppressor protein
VKVAAAKGESGARGRQPAESPLAPPAASRRRKGEDALAENKSAAKKAAAKKVARARAKPGTAPSEAPATKKASSKKRPARQDASKAAVRKVAAKKDTPKAPVVAKAKSAQSVAKEIVEKEKTEKALAQEGKKMAETKPSSKGARGFGGPGEKAGDRSRPVRAGRKAAAASPVKGADAPDEQAVTAVARAVARPSAGAVPPAPPIASVTPVRVELPEGYRPSPEEPYMNPMQLEYFRRKLLKWREELVEESRQTLDHLRSEVRDVGDELERATRESENALELRTRDRYRKLIAKIDAALRRIEEGSYGYCDETGEPIGLERLEARPIATLSLDAQERRELLQRQLGE